MSGTARRCHYPDRCDGAGTYCAPASPCPFIVPAAPPPPALYAITDNGVVTTDTHLTAAAAIERTRTLDARFPQHQHHFVPLYLHPAPTHR